MKSLEIFLNFPVMDMNMNVLWLRGSNPDAEQVARMNAFWGDDSWEKIVYKKVATLFPDLEEKVKRPNEAVVQGFRERLQKVAGFKHVPEPLAMTNNQGAVVYYLFFATHKPVADNIVKDIFKKHAPKLR
jgi:three-Cys-motif partner protein